MRHRHAARNCLYCGGAFARRGGLSRTRDHVRPEWDGGTLIIIACWQCNNDKGHMFLTQWLEVLRFKKDARVDRVQTMIERYPQHARPTGRHHPGQQPAPRSDGEAYLIKLRAGTLDKPSTPAGLPSSDDGKLGCQFCKKRFQTAEGLKTHTNIKHFRSVRLAKEEEARQYDSARTDRP